jgi:hypothetical protein
MTPRTPSRKALAWIVGDDTGMSSKSIWRVMMGLSEEGALEDVPYRLW